MSDDRPSSLSAEHRKIRDRVRKHMLSGDRPYYLSEQLARICANSPKAIADKRRFEAELGKLTAERDKFAAEALKLHRDRRLSPWLAFAAFAGGLGGIIAGAAAILRVARLIP